MQKKYITYLKKQIKIRNIPVLFGYLLFVALYFLSAKGSQLTSGSNEMLHIFGLQYPIGLLAPICSSISSIVLICMVVFHRRIGFYTAMVILIVRAIRLARGMTLFHPMSLPAFFTTVVALLAIIIIYHKSRRIVQEHETHKKQLVDFTNSIIDAFSICIDGKDSYTNGHSLRVARYTKMLAQKLGEDEATAQKYYNIAMLHDIGKIGIPDEILNKPGKLTEEEYDTIKTHTYRGFEILKRVKTQKNIAEGAYYHHERFDGKGYPTKLNGDKIPWIARIISVADAFDAMNSTRPYRTKLPMEQIVKEIKDCSGSQFDPVVAKAFLELYEEGAFDNIKTE
jgi:energy-coupling factor transport system substrate-specific component